MALFVVTMAVSAVLTFVSLGAGYAVPWILTAVAALVTLDQACQWYGPEIQRVSNLQGCAMKNTQPSLNS